MLKSIFVLLNTCLWPWNSSLFNIDRCTTQFFSRYAFHRLSLFLVYLLNGSAYFHLNLGSDKCYMEFVELPTISVQPTKFCSWKWAFQPFKPWWYSCIHPIVKWGYLHLYQLAWNNSASLLCSQRSIQEIPFSILCVDSGRDSSSVHGSGACPLSCAVLYCLRGSVVPCWPYHPNFHSMYLYLYCIMLVQGYRHILAYTVLIYKYVSKRVNKKNK